MRCGVVSYSVQPCRSTTHHKSNTTSSNSTSNSNSSIAGGSSGSNSGRATAARGARDVTCLEPLVCFMFYVYSITLMFILGLLNVPKWRWQHRNYPNDDSDDDHTNTTNTSTGPKPAYSYTTFQWGHRCYHPFLDRLVHHTVRLYPVAQPTISDDILAATAMTPQC